MELLAITAPLYVLDGTPQAFDAVSGLAAMPAPPKPARGRERDFLFVHLALSGPAEAAEALADELTADLAGRFFAGPGSVTSALRRAILDTNDRLLRHNLTLRTPHEGALTCAVLHGDELYTLQVGEGLAFLGHNFGVERLPVQPPRQPIPLGRSAGIDIRFAYHRLQSGDMMLLADPRLAHLTGATLAPALVDTEIESGLDALRELVAGETARLLLVEFADELPSTLPVTFQHSKQPAAPRSAARAATAAVVAGQAAAQPLRPRREGDPPLPRTAAEATAPIVPAASGEAVAGLETSARRAASTSARGLSRAFAWLAVLLERLGGRPSSDAAIPWALPATIAVIVPVVLAAVVTSVYLQRGNNAQLSDIKEQMLAEMALAESSADDATARGHYDTVLLIAAEAEAMRPGDLEVASIRASAREALDRIDGVTRMMATVFYEYEPGVNLTRLALGLDEGGVTVGVGDNASTDANRVMLHPTDDAFQEATAEQPSTLAFGGQAVGTEVVGPIVDLLWLAGSAAATRDAVAMLDRTGVLFTYFPNLGDIRGVRLGNSSAWLNPVAMASYLGRLYVLDAGAGQIWKYFADEGFVQHEDDATIFFSDQMGLDAAVDFDIYSEDGSLVIVYHDGRIRYYDTRSGRIQWDENTLLQNGLTTPLASPRSVKLVGRGLNASIFVLDPGTSRLVQLSRGGTLLTQYRIIDAAGNDVLRGASDFAVVEGGQRVFVAAGNSLYVAER